MHIAIAALALVAACTSAAQYDAIVLGGGVAGLRASAELWSAGYHNILVVEQADRVGGRMHEEALGSDASPNGRWLIEKGANWVEGVVPATQNPIWQIAAELNLTGACTFSFHDEKAPASVQPPLLYDAGGVITDAARLPWTQVADVLQQVQTYSCQLQKADEDDISLREALTHVAWPSPADQTNVQRLAEWFICDFDFEQAPENVSLFSFAPDDECASASARAFVSGARAVMPRLGRRGAARVLHAARAQAASSAASSALSISSSSSPSSLSSSIATCGSFFVTDQRGFSEVARHIARDYLHVPGVVRLNAFVTQIDWSAGIVTLEDGSRVTGDFLIATFSAGVVNHAIRTRTLFTPELPPAKTAAFAQVESGTYNKIFVQFPYVFWDATRDYSAWAGDAPTRGYFALWQNLERSDDPAFLPARAGIFMVTLITQVANALEALNDTQIIAQAVGVLRLMYADRTVPDPVAWFVPRWHSDRAFRGSYSNIKIGATDSEFRDMQARIGRLWFAGEHTDSEYNGFIEGAFRSGVAVGGQVVSALRARDAGASKSTSAWVYATAASVAVAVAAGAALWWRRSKRSALTGDETSAGAPVVGGATDDRYQPL